MLSSLALKSAWPILAEFSILLQPFPCNGEQAGQSQDALQPKPGHTIQNTLIKRYSDFPFRFLLYISITYTDCSQNKRILKKKKGGAINQHWKMQLLNSTFRTETTSNNTLNKNSRCPYIWSTAYYSEISPFSAQFSKDLIEIKEVQERVTRLIRQMEWLLHEEIVNRTGVSTLEREYM